MKLIMETMLFLKKKKKFHTHQTVALLLMKKEFINLLNTKESPRTNTAFILKRRKYNIFIILWDFLVVVQTAEVLWHLVVS